jgi:hypothetical protein
MNHNIRPDVSELAGPVDSGKELLIELSIDEQLIKLDVGAIERLFQGAEFFIWAAHALPKRNPGIGASVSKMQNQD